MATTRGTTPTHVFNVDVDLTDATIIYITYEQGDEIKIERTKEDITVTDKTLTVKLTQEETLAFSEGKAVRIQIRAKFGDGTAVASNIINTSVREIIKEGEI